MIDKMWKSLAGEVRQRVWIISDLQQSDLKNARYCLEKAVSDLKSWQVALDRIWYLGDAVEGPDIKLVTEMAQMQKEVLAPLGVPLRYVMGNHDFDTYKNDGDRKEYHLPFYEMVKSVPGWKSILSQEDMYFTEEFAGFQVFFLSDHGARNGSWFTTHGLIRRGEESYPYKKSAFSDLRSAISSSKLPVLTVSHYSYAGGNRPSDSLSQLLPLPKNVRAHFYGHAHIGDHIWAGKDVFRMISSVDNHKAPQINVSALENIRGEGIRSVLLEVYNDQSLGIYFRDHAKENWIQGLVLTSAW